MVFPLMANYSTDYAYGIQEQNTMKVQLDIPCTGHAPFITNELKKVDGITQVRFQIPSTFTLSYDSHIITEEEIKKLPIFQEFIIKN
ncbi:MAG: hypothetical protein V1848_03400 [Candidatus Magasanikbacteria bacterium]